MTSKLYLDTSVIIAIDEGRVSDDILDEIDSADLYTSFFVSLELAQYCVRKKINPSFLLKSISDMCVTISFSNKIAIDSAKLRDAQRKKVPKFGLADAVHLTCATSVGAKLLTCDTDFTGLYGVQLI